MDDSNVIRWNADSIGDLARTMGILYRNGAELVSANDKLVVFEDRFLRTEIHINFEVKKNDN